MEQGLQWLRRRSVTLRAFERQERLTRRAGSVARMCQRGLGLQLAGSVREGLCHGDGALGARQAVSFANFRNPADRYIHGSAHSASHQGKLELPKCRISCTWMPPHTHDAIGSISRTPRCRVATRGCRLMICTLPAMLLPQLLLEVAGR